MVINPVNMSYVEIVSSNNFKISLRFSIKFVEIFNKVMSITEWNISIDKLGFSELCFETLYGWIVWDVCGRIVLVSDKFNEQKFWSKRSLARYSITDACEMRHFVEWYFEWAVVRYVWYIWWVKSSPTKYQTCQHYGLHRSTAQRAQERTRKRVS